MPNSHRQPENRRCLLLAATMAGLFLSSVTVLGAPPSPSWKAGAAGAKITPDTNMWMAGYAARTKPAEGVELDLYAKALVIEDRAGSRWALVTMDLIGVPRNVRLFVAERAEKQFGIAPARLVLNASHTHSGPELRTGRTHGTDDPARHDAEATAYTEKLQATLTRLIGEACEKIAPATLDYGHARCGFAMNRRTPDGKGDGRTSRIPTGRWINPSPCSAWRAPTERRWRSCSATAVTAPRWGTRSSAATTRAMPSSIWRRPTPGSSPCS